MQTQHSSQIQFDLMPNAKFIIKCPQCPNQSLFQSDGEWEVRMGDYHRQDDGTRVFEISPKGYGYGYRCVTCPFGHTIPLYSNANPKSLLGSVSIIVL